MKTTQPHVRLSKWRRILFALVGLLTYTMAYSQLPTATQVAANMRVGFNVGNTLEAIGGETAWGNPMITQSFINSVKAAGFNTIRLPIAWDNHATNGTIDAAWMARVKQVVDYCISQNLYVIINIHWDNGWLENNVTTAAQSSVNAKQQNYWTQIANYFKAYDQRVLFASANEPNVENATGMSVLMSYHQTFVNAVRATGGNNSSRTLIIQGPSTDIEKTNNLMNSMPTDQIANRLMAEVHYYTPYQFCLMTADADWGIMFYYWGSGYHSTIDPTRNATWGEESDLNNFFGMMKTKFVNNGIPVILGEFGAYKRTGIADQALHNASVEYFNKYVTQQAIANGMIPYYWDTGGLIDRNTGAIKDQGVLNAIMQGAAASNNLTVSPTTQTFTSAASSQSVTVTSNVSWTVTDNQSWITTSVTSGSNNGSFNVTTTANTGTASRTGTVTVTGSGITRTISVTQSGVSNSLTVSPTSQTFAASASSQTVTVTSNVSWTVTDNQSWITTSATSGSNNGSFSVTVTANTGTASRTGTVTITGGSITRTVSVTQSGTSSCTPTTITPYTQINGGAWSQTANASVAVGGSVKFGPHPTSGGSWSWTGPNSFTATTREVTISNIQSSQAGTYVARYTNASGCQSTQNFVVTVTGGSTTVVVRARGVLGTETIQLRLNGTTVATWTLTTAYANYSASGSGAVTVYFTNDSGNRDVQVDYVTIGGTTYQSESQSTNTGVWQNNTCGGSNSEWLHCNGYISYTSASRLSEGEPLESESVLSLYPNPALDGRFFIEIPAVEGAVQINILDLQGRLVYSHVSTDSGLVEIQSNLNSGIYMVNIQAGAFKASKKLIVH